MPVAVLLVEGELDAQILGVLLAGHPAVTAGKCSKNALKPRVREERQSKRTGICYLRDRDFDYSPPSDLTAPCVDESDDHGPVGWHWCRHEIENYMVQPEFVAACLGVDADAYTAVVLDAAQRIRCYEAARWTIGQARSQLPPKVKLDTKPSKLEFYIPEDCGQDAACSWAREHVGEFRNRILPHLDEQALVAQFEHYCAFFSDSVVGDCEQILVWFSGKDLMAAMSGWLGQNGISSPGELRVRLRDWMMRNGDTVLSVLGEWHRFVSLLRTE